MASFLNCAIKLNGGVWKKNLDEHYTALYQTYIPPGFIYVIISYKNIVSHFIHGIFQGRYNHRFVDLEPLWHLREMQILRRVIHSEFPSTQKSKKSLNKHNVLKKLEKCIDRRHHSLLTLRVTSFILIPRPRKKIQNGR